MTSKTLAAVFAAFLFAVAPLGTARADNHTFNWSTVTAEEIRDFLATWLDVTAKDEDGWTPLHKAARLSRDSAVIPALIEAGADVTARENEEWTPLHLAAAYNDNPAVVTALMDDGADVWARTDKDATPLHLAAAYNKNPAVTTALINGGANTETKLKSKDIDYTPLHRAVLSDNLAVITALINGGADMAARVRAKGTEDVHYYYQGATPLHLAAIYGKFKSAEALIAAGADVNAVDDEGRTPIDTARAFGFNAKSIIYRVIKAAGGECNRRC